MNVNRISPGQEIEMTEEEYKNLHWWPKLKLNLMGILVVEKPTNQRKEAK